MKHRSGALAALAAATSATVFTLSCVTGEAPGPPQPDPTAAMALIRDAAMGSDWSWLRLGRGLPPARASQ